MKPEYSLYCSIAALFGFIGLTMLVLVGPEPIVVWFLVSLPLWWERQEREWRDRE